MQIRLSGYILESIVDGPGLRTVVFTQGCPHHCPGCHNPGTHDFNGGYEMSIEDIISEIKKNPLLDGVTLSGGDPMFQVEESLKLAREVKKLGLNVMLYTGYTFERIIEMGKSNPSYSEILNYLDYLVDGPFILKLRDLTLSFRGSQNQRIIDVPHYLQTNEIKAIEL